MKSLFPALIMATAFSCSSANDVDNKTEDSAIPPAAEQTSSSGFSMSDQDFFSAKIVWKTPLVSESFDNSAEVYLLDKSAQPLTSSRLTRFHLYMMSMGHPSIKENEIQFNQVDPGHWTVSRIFFSMGGSKGSWVVDLDAEANGQADHVRVSIDHEVE